MPGTMSPDEPDEPAQPDEPARPGQLPRRGIDDPGGFVVVDKQAGWTSHDVVARCRRLLGTRKVGHAGTLDPDATGVLIVGVGRGDAPVAFRDGVAEDLRRRDRARSDHLDPRRLGRGDRALRHGQASPWRRFERRRAR